MHIPLRSPVARTACLLLAMLLTGSARGQSVCLPLPRLLTLVPTGAQRTPGGATTVEVRVSGENLDAWEEGGVAVEPRLVFSDPGIVARPATTADGTPEKDRFVVTIGGDVAAGLYDARMVTALGVSSPRVFVVGDLPETLRTEPAGSVAQSFPLATGMVVGAQVTAQAADHYRLELQKGQRVVIDCAARGIESKLRPVVILADATGADLVAERRGGLLDFTAPLAATYVVKVHDLSFQGGGEFFYRLVAHDVAPGAPLPARQRAVEPVPTFSWPPTALPTEVAAREHEADETQRVSLPLDVAGRFFPAADVDTYEFAAEGGETWWVEVASERIGAPCNPAVVVQYARAGEGGATSWEDVLELADIPAAIRPSTNHYAYDGPPYETGSADCLGRLAIKESGTYRLQIRDLFGGTRDEPDAAYRLVVRRAQPEFALVCWPLHMELRNGDRAALSKPLALRGGGTVSLEVAALRRDGFDGPVELVVEGLPEGVTATGLRIPAGQTRGQILLTAADAPPRGLSSVRVLGRGTVDGQAIERPCRIAGHCWPVRDGWSEIPFPRLLADTVVSAGSVEGAPLTLRTTATGLSAAAPIEAKEGTTIEVPLELVKREEIQGGTFQMRVIGPGFDAQPGFELDVASPTPLAVDLAKLKIPAGDHAFALVASAVTKHVGVPAPGQQPAAPADIAEILVSNPIHVRVLPAVEEKKP